MEWTRGGALIGSAGGIEKARGGFHLGIGGTIILALLGLVLPRIVFDMPSGGPGADPDAGPGAVPQTIRHQPETAQDRREEPEVKVVSFILDDVQKNWDRILPAQEHVLIIMRGWCCTGIRIPHRAGGRRRRWARFIVRGMRRFIWIWDFFGS